MSFSASEIAQLFARPEAELRERLAHTEDADLAGVCRVRGVTVGATREETLETLVASKVTDIPEQAQDSKSKPVVARKAPPAASKLTGIGNKLKSKSATGLDKVRKLAEDLGPSRQRQSRHSLAGQPDSWLLLTELATFRASQGSPQRQTRLVLEQTRCCKRLWMPPVKVRTSSLLLLLVFHPRCGAQWVPCSTSSWPLCSRTLCNSTVQ